MEFELLLLLHWINFINLLNKVKASSHSRLYPPPSPPPHTHTHFRKKTSGFQNIQLQNYCYGRTLKWRGYEMLDYAYCLSTKNRNQLLLIGYLLACRAVDGTRDPGQGANNADRPKHRHANTPSPAQQPVSTAPGGVS